jgi:diguanylate cyclase (GGDEF)-like protein
VATASPVGAGLNPIDRLEQVIPDVVWLVLAASLAVGAVGGLSAIVSGHRARRRTREVAAISAAALIDPLTHVFNRRGFSEAVERELDRASRHGRPLAIAYLDVRGLKAVNDTHGHVAGDRLLREAAGLLLESARAHDVVGRVGGDEMAVLLPEQSAEGAAVVSGRIQRAVPAHRAALGLSVPWDLTVGTATFPEDGQTLEELVRVADRRLYEQRGIALG